jgi:Protein of unknown function (DUF1345)
LDRLAPVELLPVKQIGPAERAAHILLAGLTIADSWLLVPTMLTLHYADMFYSADPQQPPLVFPETKAPLFWDFVYFSFTIAAACQTADVATTQLGIRKAVIAHSIISFLFNVSILGFAINVGRELINNLWRNSPHSVIYPCPVGSRQEAAGERANECKAPGATNGRKSAGRSRSSGRPRRTRF